MSNTIVITTLDSVTVNGKPVGSITNALGNGNATAQEIHDALSAYVAPLLSAQSDKATLQSSLDSMMLAFNAATTDEERAPIIAQANALTTSGQLKLLQDAAAKHQADLTAAQAKISALTPQPTPMPTPDPSA